MSNVKHPATPPLPPPDEAAEGGRPAGAARAYHHGDLRAALIAAAEQLVAANGLERFSLRECAKLAGVSAAAPAYHFGSAAGLLQAVAVAGFDELAKRMQAATVQVAPDKQVSAMALAYISFARERSGSFRVTFGGAVVPSKSGNSDLIAASERTFAILREAVSALCRKGSGADVILRKALFVWSWVHGFASLLVDQRMSFLAEVPGSPVGEDALIASALEEFQACLAKG